MKKKLKPLFLLLCIFGTVWFRGADTWRMLEKFDFWTRIGWIIMGFGGLVILGTIAAQQMIEIHGRDDQPN